MSVEISTFALFLNVSLRIITGVVFLFFLIPLLIREARVQNGLKQLRIEMLLTGSIIFFVNTSGLVIIILKGLGIPQELIKVITDAVSFFNTFGFLVYALIKLRIYTQHYTPEQKKMHEEFAKFEEAQEDKQTK